MMRISTPSLLLLAWLSVGCTFGDKSPSSDDDASESDPWGDGSGGAGTPGGGGTPADDPADSDGGATEPDNEDTAASDDTGDVDEDDVDSEDYEGDVPGECTDRADNDRDGLYDCDDPDCFASPDCTDGAGDDTGTAGSGDEDTGRADDTAEPEAGDTDDTDPGDTDDTDPGDTDDTDPGDTDDTDEDDHSDDPLPPLPPTAVCSVEPDSVAASLEPTDWIGEESYDPSGTALTYAWTLIETPEGSEAVFSDDSSDTEPNELGFVADLAGVYLAQLVVTNEAGLESEPCLVALEAVSEQPIAICEVTPGSVHPLIESADWIGEDAYDPTGLDLTYSWSLTSVPPGSSATLPPGTENRLDFVPDVSGTYVAQLIVTNAAGVSSLPCTAVLEAVGDRPVAVCDVDPGAISPVVESADWIGNDSYDPDDLALDYYWSLISTPEGSTAELPDGGADREGFVADLPGSYVAQLVVTNAAGISSLPCTATLEVIAGPPVAICEVNPEMVRPIVDSADWMGNDSFDPMGSSLTYIWNLKSKPSGSSASMPSGAADRTDFFPDMAGTYVGELVVINEFGDASDPCLATLVAIPTDNLWVEMFWESPGDADAEDDMDLHFLQPGGEPYVSPTDCYWGSCRGGLDWGIPGVLSDNPFLDLDDFRSGPENVRIERPAEGTYTVVVHDFDSSAAEYHEVSLVTVNIYLYGALAWTDTREVWGEDEYVDFATINTATDVITPL